MSRPCSILALVPCLLPAFALSVAVDGAFKGLRDVIEQKKVEGGRRRKRADPPQGMAASSVAANMNKGLSSAFVQVKLDFGCHSAEQSHQEFDV